MPNRLQFDMKCSNLKCCSLLSEDGGQLSWWNSALFCSCGKCAWCFIVFMELTLTGVLKSGLRSVFFWCTDVWGLAVADLTNTGDCIWEFQSSIRWKLYRSVGWEEQRRNLEREKDEVIRKSGERLSNFWCLSKIWKSFGFFWCFSIFSNGLCPNVVERLVQDWKAVVLYSVFKCVSKLATFCAIWLGKSNVFTKTLLCQKRSVIFVCPGWISPPHRNPVCVLELHQLCFLMPCDLIYPVLLPLALRLIFNPCSAYASSTEPGCQLAWKPGRHMLGNALYLVTCYFSSGMKPGTRASPSIPILCSLFTALSLTNSLNLSGKQSFLIPWKSTYLLT